MGKKKQAYRITVRQLESIIRLSEALARLHLNTEVTVSYVEEAARLLKQSIIHIDTNVVSVQSNEDGMEVDNDRQVSVDKYDKAIERITAKVIDAGKMKVSDVINWYVGEYFDGAGDDALKEERQAIKGIVFSLIDKEGILVSIVRSKKGEDRIVKVRK